MGAGFLAFILKPTVTQAEAYRVRIGPHGYS
jgi:hypothetical protein